MSSPGVGSKDFLDQNGIKAWANVPREVILRNTASDKPLEMRLLFGMVLWSWCGPNTSESVVRKNDTGWIVRDGAGNPVPARLRDFVQMLGVGKANITRASQRLMERNQLRREGRTLVLVLRPPADFVKEVVKIDNTFWNIAGVVIRRENLPAEPAAKAESVGFLESCSTNWKQQLRDVKTSNRKLLLLGLSERGILLKKSKKNKEQTNEPPAVPVVRLSGVVNSSMRDKIRSAATARYKNVPTLLEGRPLDELADIITNDAILERFERQLDLQKPEIKKSWMLLVPIARSCAKAQAAADEEDKNLARKAAAKAEERVRDQEWQRLQDERIEADTVRKIEQMGPEFERRVQEKLKEVRSQHPKMSRDQVSHFARQTVRYEIRLSIT